MGIGEALEILKIESLDNLESKTLTKIYRKLMKRHHPDLYTDRPDELKEHEEIAKKINEAYEILNKALEKSKMLRQFEQTKSVTEIFAIIPFNELISLYGGSIVKLRHKDGEFKLTSSNIRANRIVLDIGCTIIIDGINYTFSSLKPWVIKDEYELNCDIPMMSDNIIDVIVLAYGKRVELTLKSVTTRLRLKYTNNVVLILNLRKVIIDKEEQ